MPIAEKLKHIRATLPEGVTLIAVSKYHTADAMREAYRAGQRDFGESRVQELKAKEAELRAECPEIRWHYIGHLQTNKVRDLLKLPVTLIHSVDSVRLMDALEAECARAGRTQDILLEVHVAEEETKTGFAAEELSEALKEADTYPHLHIRGVMGMASHTDDATEIRRCFRAVAALAEPGMDISMGMSEDYGIAVECGSTMVRVGSAIFG